MMTIQYFIKCNRFNHVSHLITNNIKRNNYGLRCNWSRTTKTLNLYTPHLNVIRYNSSMAKVPKLAIPKGHVVRILKLAKTEKFILIAAMGCLVISSAITMSVPFAMGRILDLIFDKNANNTEEAMQKLKHISMVLCGVFLVGGLANFGRVYLFNTASLRIVRDLRSQLYKSMLNQEIGWFDRKGTGELINRLSTDVYLVGNSLGQNLSDGVRSTFMCLAGTCMMMYTSPQLTGVTACVVPCVVGIAIIYGRYVRTITRALLDKLSLISKAAEERLSNIRTVKIFCKESDESRSYDNLLTDALELGYKDAKARATFFGTTGLSGNIIIISVLYYGGTLVVNGHLSIGALTSFILYAGYCAISINGISNFFSELNKSIGAAERFWEILDRKCAIPLNFGIIPKQQPRGEVMFNNVTFKYPARPDATVLEDFNLKLIPGETTALVGRSGSGKTTVITLLLRLYDPSNGEIVLDNAHLRDLSPIWLRSHIGVVSQEPVLFSGTIRENILYGLKDKEAISEAQFEDIVRKTYINEFTTRLPDGLDTLVGQRGVMLSGGQKQRVAIARALIKNPTILVLDEATSALDSVSEELVQNALQELVKGRTCLTIAHRLSTIRNSNTIAVINNGRVVEQGSYEDLVAKDGSVFKELVKKQATLMTF